MSEPSPNLGFSTLAVHSGVRAAPSGAHPTAVPLVNASAFSFDTVEELDEAFDDPSRGSVYSRFGNPTVDAFERAVAALEGGESAVAFGSGMAALHAALLACGAVSGSRVVAARDLYGGTLGLLGRIMSRQGIQITYVDANDADQVQAALEEQQPAALLIESIANPLLKVADVPRLASLAAQTGAASIVDNTFATPVLYRPLGDGATLSLHSVTKYLAGHGDVTAGVVVGSSTVCSAAREVARLVGGVLAPSEAWLALRGMRTLALRVERHCANACLVAEYLSEHPGVARVYYPGLPSHPEHELATRLFGGAGFGGVVAFDLKNAGRLEVFRVLNRLRLFTVAPTLGDCASLVLYPAMASHRALSPAERAAMGISDGLLRLSIGIEDAGDLIADLDQALQS